MTNQPSEYRALRTLINAQFDAYEQALSQADLPEPFLTEGKLHTTDSPQFLPSHELIDARNLLAGSLGMMVNLVQNQAERLITESLSHHRSAALSVVTESGVADALLAAGPDGLPIDELAKAVKVHPYPLRSALRLLCNTSNIFTEPRLGVFANNRSSLLLVKGSPIRSFVKWQTWFSLRHSSEISNNYRADPKLHEDRDHLTTAAATAWKFAEKGYPDMWAWAAAEEPERIAEFGDAMNALGLAGNGAVVADYPWETLPEGSTVVDVGGGQGGMLRSILGAHKHLKGVLQDRPETVALGKEAFAKETPDLVAEGRIAFDDYDFFTTQPRKAQAVYAMRQIIHDWSDPKCIEILKHQAESMDKTSRLIVIDTVIRDPVQSAYGVARPEGAAPYPLPESSGIGQNLPPFVDSEMVSALHSTERTLPEFEALFNKAGLKLVNSYRTRSSWGIVEAVLQ